MGTRYFLILVGCTPPKEYRASGVSPVSKFLGVGGYKEAMLSARAYGICVGLTPSILLGLIEGCIDSSYLHLVETFFFYKVM